LFVFIHYLPYTLYITCSILLVNGQFNQDYSWSYIILLAGVSCFSLQVLCIAALVSGLLAVYDFGLNSVFYQSFNMYTTMLQE